MENQNTEWKAIWKDEYLAWICGFANSCGGSLYIGIDDDGKSVGLENLERLCEDLPNKIRNYLGIVCDISVETKDNCEYLKIDVPAYSVPISYKGVFYYRSGSTNQRLDGSELNNFLLRKQKVNWDGVAIPTLTVEDIDIQSIADFKKKAVAKGRIEDEYSGETTEEFLKRLHMMNCDNGSITCGGALTFGKNPDKWFSGAFIKIGYFANDADLLYQDEIHGSLFNQVDKAMELLYTKYFKALISYDGLQRKETFNFPRDVVREALLNAVIHKDYSSGVPIQISVYEDKMYIGNVGTLPLNWTLKDLLGKHTSVPFNPDIAHAFYLAGYIESWGRGVEKMFNYCHEYGCKMPEYTVHPRDMMIKIFPADDTVNVENKSINVEKEPINTEKEPINEPINDTINLNEDEKLVVDLLSKDGTVSYDTLVLYTRFSRSKITRLIKGLKEKKVIEYVGSKKTGFWKIMKG